MERAHIHPQGLWLPLITPFRDGRLDEASVRRLVRHYAALPVDGLILGATTGEGMTLDEGEKLRLSELVAAECGNGRRRMPLFLGLSGSDTRQMVKTVARTAPWLIDGYLIAAPYYSRPSQQGIYEHFSALARATDKPILLYNIPARTAVNIANDTMLKLAEQPNIVGVKDCATEPFQSFDLLRRRRPGFSVLTGEDALFFEALTQGADGGILASAHIETERFASVRRLLQEGDLRAALAVWRTLFDLTRLLFAEPSPAPIKHWLWRSGLIASPELRLPMTPVTEALAARIDREIAAHTATEPA